MSWWPRYFSRCIYSLQANAKTVERAPHVDRDAQFRYINDLAKARLRRSLCFEIRVALCNLFDLATQFAGCAQGAGPRPGGVVDLWSFRWRRRSRGVGFLVLAPKLFPKSPEAARCAKP